MILDISAQVDEVRDNIRTISRSRGQYYDNMIGMYYLLVEKGYSQEYLMELSWGEFMVLQYKIIDIETERLEASTRNAESMRSSMR